VLNRRILALAAAVLMPLGLLAAPAYGVGPWYPHDTVLNGQYKLIPLKNQAMITREKYGYRFRAGQQNSHIVVTRTQDGLRFHDAGTKEWKSLDPGCDRVRVDKGVAAVCSVPRDVSTTKPMLLEVWPRLGDDYLDTSSLGAEFQVAALMDDGFDTVYLGAGDDFVNGAMKKDVVRGGAGDDWIRTGIGNDDIDGGPGDDKLVGADGADIIRGGPGADFIGGGPGADQLFGDDMTSKDVLSCGGGRDRATFDGLDRTRKCEVLYRARAR
jgi:serralysin